MDDRSKGRPGPVRRTLKIAGWMILMAIAGAWVMALAYPLAIKAGLTESTASRLPNFGLCVGGAIGLVIATVRMVKYVLTKAALVLVAAGVFWFFGLEGESLLVAFGMSEHAADWLPFTAFWFGLLLCGFALSVDFYEKMAALRRRRIRSGH